MKDDSGDVIKLNEILHAGFKQIATLTLLLIFLRIPPIWTKLPLMVSVLLAGLRWINPPLSQKACSEKTKGTDKTKIRPRPYISRCTT